ncbi:peptidylprolyl isomerase [Candidatus Pelagibacter sp.]|nr:peptidylprolyl isomerase [Candidatus Pelagibacter sp.]
MILKKHTLIVTLLLIFSVSKVLAGVSIAVKVNNTIISSHDIKRESLYLKALNTKLENLDNKQILRIAKESIIREKIKLIELNKYYVLDQSNPLLDKVVKDFYLKLNMQNEIEFENHLKKYDLNISEIKKKIEIETTWNDLINNNYRNQIKIDKNKLLEKIDNLKADKQKKSYLLSEIVFEIKVGQSIDQVFFKIEESIKEIGFENTANIYSITDSSKFGGKIGWVDEENLAPIIKSEIQKINLEGYTKPITINNNLLILKLQDTKEEVVKINKSLLLDEMMRYEFNAQLSKYSKIYYNKVKINTEIYEF